MQLEETQSKHTTLLASRRRNVSSNKTVFLFVKKPKLNLIGLSFTGTYRSMGGLLAFVGLMSPEPATVSKLPIPTIEDIIYSEEFIKTQGSQQQIDCLVRQAKIPDEYILKISDITIGQRNNPTWHLTRRGRLTASNFGCVLKAKRVTQSLLTEVSSSIHANSWFSGWVNRPNQSQNGLWFLF